MTKLTVIKRVEIDASKIWQLVSKADAMENYLPEVITACELDSNQPGGRRVSTTDGGKVYETILRNDRDNMIFQYSVDNDNTVLPYTDYIATVSVKKVDNRQSELSWSASFEPNGLPEQTVKTMLESILTTIINNICDVAKKL